MEGPPKVTEIFVRSVATPQRTTGSLRDYSINPYRGCTFGCSYCYAKKFVFDDSKKRYDWGHWVEVKANAEGALLQDLPRLFDQDIFIGSATDPYQPLERRLGLTRRLLEILLLAHPRHVHIQTRSPHIVHDIALLREFGERLRVGISIPTDSEVVRKAFEPRAPSIGRRIETGRVLREAGISVSASVAPLLPCTPKRLAAKLKPAFSHAGVGRINFYGDEGGARAIYAAHGWDRYLRASHEAEVRAALKDAGLFHDNYG